MNEPSATLTLKIREIKLILKSLKKCVPDVDDQREVFDLVQYLEHHVDK
jgi:hypothetical protein